MMFFRTQSLILTCIWVSVSGIAFAQNIVNNPSFESFSSCPAGPSELSKANFWSNPSEATPDYFHACNVLGGVSTPNNLLGNENPRIGQGYAGFIAYEDFPLGCPNPLITTGWREYAQNELAEPMIAGQTYCVQFYVSPADQCRYATDDIAVHFSQTRINSPDSTALNLTTHVVNTNGIISDTSQWTLIRGSYTAAGGEQFMIIGNFNDDLNTTISCVNPSAINPFAYYFIEDVWVAPGNQCCEIQLGANVEEESCLGNDGSASVFPSNGANPYIYQWSNGGSNQTINSLSAGFYEVTVIDNIGCAEILGGTVGGGPGLAVSGVGQNAACGSCDGAAEASVANGRAPFTYAWSASASSQDTRIASNLCSGLHTVTVTDVDGCAGTGSVIINGGTGSISASVAVNPANCGASCQASATLSPSGGNPPYGFQWDAAAGNQTTATASNLCAGTYSVSITDAGGGTAVFWTENFGTGCNAGTLATAYNGPNGNWSVTNTGANGNDANQWFISATEAGMGLGNCGDGCTGSTNATLHLGSNLAGAPDPGAAYYESNPVLCDFFSVSCGATNKRVESPTINCTGKSSITLSFNYLHGGNSTDLASICYFDGTGWNCNPLPKSPTTCAPQGEWASFSTPLPASANNNPAIKIGFVWVNDDFGDADDPSVAIDDIELSAASGNSSCQFVRTVTIPVSGSLTTSIATTNASCAEGTGGAANLTVTSAGGPFNFSWSNGGTTEDLSNLTPGTYTVTVSDQSNCQAIDTAVIGLGNPSGPPGIWNWRGLSNDDWFEPCNWDKVSLPDLNSKVIIPGGTPFEPTIRNDTAYCRNITIQHQNAAHLTTNRSSGGHLVKRP